MGVPCPECDAKHHNSGRLGRELSSHALPLAYHYFPGKGGDCPTMETMINKIPIDLKTKKLSTNNRFKQYLLADAGYCSKNNRAFLRSKGWWITLSLIMIAMQS